jgi:dipeptidyl aminopeptidase/acylaminoacyl peptidase
MAYNRQSAGLAPDSPRGAPRPWILDIKTGETKPLYTDSQIIGYGPLWSPDGQKIATYDGVNGRIQVYDLNQNNSTFVPSKSGITGSFSPDGQKLYFTDLIETEVGIQTQIFVADVATGLVEPISSIPGSGRYFTYDLPQWSPDGDWIAIGIQSAPDNPARQIWLVTVSGGQYQQITTDPQFTNSIYSWNDLGDGLLFQRYDLGSGKSSSETAIWWIERHQLQVISENASMARWLP